MHFLGKGGIRMFEKIIELISIIPKIFNGGRPLDNLYQIKNKDKKEED